MKLVIPIVFSFLCLSVSAQLKYPDSWTEGKYITVNGARLWVVTVGKGQPLFLIAGGPGVVHVGLRRFDSLAANHLLVYFDGYGRGKSDTAKDVKEYTIERDIEDLEGLRKAMGFGKIIVLGHSYGTVVAQGYALKYGQNVSQLILCSPFHSYVSWQENDDNSNHEIRVNYPEVWDTLMILRKQGYISSDSLHQEIYGRVPYGFLYAYNPDNFVRRGGKPYPNPFNSKLYYQMVGKDGDFIVGSDIGNFDYRKELKNLKMPVLVLAGRYDRVAVPYMQVQYKEYCPQAQFVMFERSGHNPQVEEKEKLYR